MMIFIPQRAHHAASPSQSDNNDDEPRDHVAPPRLPPFIYCNVLFCVRMYMMYIHTGVRDAYSL